MREFLNIHVKKVCQKYQIYHFTSSNPYHASIVERSIRTLREKFGKYMTDNHTKVFLPKLQDFIFAYNTTRHTALPNLAPSEVNSRNELKVWKHQFGSYFRRAPGYYGKPKLKVGQVVRISKLQGKFKKSSDTSFTEELFVVTHVLKTRPITYKIASLGEGEPIIGAFYRAELLPINQE